MAAKSQTQHPVRFTIVRKHGQVAEILTNSSQLNHFLDLLKMSRARNTWINYGHDLKQFFDCIHKPPELIDRRDCLTFMKQQQKAGMSEATINRRLAAVSAGSIIASSKSDDMRNYPNCHYAEPRSVQRRIGDCFFTSRRAMTSRLQKPVFFFPWIGRKRVSCERA